MATLIYIHGFLSSPNSHKATQTREWLSNHAPHIGYECPFLSPYPKETQQQLATLIDAHVGETLGFVGSSLGGFWSSWLVENFGHKAVLINPSVRPFDLFHTVAGVPQQNHHTNDVYCMTEAHSEQMKAFYHDHLADLSRYWLLAQTGDETLDYRLAESHYEGCRQTIEEGGDHSFQRFERHLPAITGFLFPELYES